MLNKKVLIVSHGHPDINKGGAEVAAYNLFNEYLSNGVDAYFLARTDQAPHGGAAFSTRNTEREIMFHTTMDDPFLFSNIKTRHMWQEFRDLLNVIKPDVVHFHHYFLLGIEMIQEVKKTLPNCKIVLTLHEFLAICHRQGLMFKSNDKLCYKSSPRDCHGCFPNIQPGDFFLREKYIKSIFANVDQFISPSNFLKQRYVDWGLDESNILVIENGQPAVEAIDKPSSEKVRFAFFGQVNPFKGIDVLLESIQYLDRNITKGMVIDIHGANLDQQKKEFKAKVKKLLANSNANVQFHGSYEMAEMPALLAQTDWAIIPSIWWENSPMVIQEAFNNKTPLIVSDIGGMAEKVQDGITGFHFRAGKASSLANVITKVVESRELQKQLTKNIQQPMTIEECAKEHFSAYGLTA